MHTPLLSPYALPDPPISFFSILSLIEYLMKTTDHLAPHYALSHVPFSLLKLHQKISPGPRLTPWMYRNMISFLRWGVVNTSPKPQVRGPPLVACPRLLIQYIRSYPPYWRPFLHPKTEDAPYRGDTDPHITGRHWIPLLIGARHNLIIFPVKIPPGFIPVRFDCSLLLHSLRPSIVCPRCVHVCSTGVQYSKCSSGVGGYSNVENVGRL